MLVELTWVNLIIMKSYSYIKLMKLLVNKGY